MIFCIIYHASFTNSNKIHVTEGKLRLSKTFRHYISIEILSCLKTLFRIEIHSPDILLSSRDLLIKLEINYELILFGLFCCKLFGIKSTIFSSFQVSLIRKMSPFFQASKRRQSVGT